jgi:putative (di)nucleoside polyphosphate hydrolase
MNDKNLDDYRPCVGIMVINPRGLVWMGRRADAPADPEGPGAWWQMPQGGIDPGEDPEKAAFRELREETSIRSVTVLGRTNGWLTYELPGTLKGTAWKGRYRGQKQIWFAARFTGSETEISLEPPPGCEKEFDTWDWVPIDSAVKRVVSFKRGVYEAMINQLGHHARSL